jgi:hypothetical protein
LTFTPRFGRTIMPKPAGTNAFGEGKWHANDEVLRDRDHLPVKQVEMGVPAKEIARKYGVCDKTVYLWSLTNLGPASHGFSLSRHRSRQCHPAAP